MRKNTSFLLILSAAIVFSSCAGAGLFLGEAELLALTRGRFIVSSLSRTAGRAGTRALASDVLVLSRQGSKRVVSASINNSRKEVVEILSKRSIRHIASNQIINLPGDIYIVKATKLNVRSGPGVNYPKVATIPQGRPVAVRNKKDGWFETWVDDQIQGWVSDKYVEELESLIKSSETEDRMVSISSQEVDLLRSMNAVLPDRDADEIPDKYDDCPDAFGNKATHGCPDFDGDGVPDKDDKCKQESGLLRFSGCPDRDNDGVPDNEDRCPSEVGIPANFGCPQKLVTYIYAKDSDGDGLLDDVDYCPNIYARTSNGCPYEELIEPVETKPFQMGIGIAGGFVLNTSFADSERGRSGGGLGFSPFIFTAVKLSNRARLQLDFCYSKRGFVFKDPSYEIESADLNFNDFRGYAKINIHSFFLGGYYGKVLSATQREGSGTKYSFYDKGDYPGTDRPINPYTYGLSIGIEKIFRDGFLFGIGYDHALSNYINENYDGFVNNKVDFYFDDNPELKLHYLYVALGYRF